MKNLKFNKGNILRIIEIGLVGVILVGGYYSIKGNKKDTKNVKSNTREEQNVDSKINYSEEALQNFNNATKANTSKESSKPIVREDGLIEFPNGYVFNPFMKKIEVGFDDLLDEDISKFPTIIEQDGITYLAPEGYYLVNRAGSIYAIRKTEIIEVKNPIIEFNELVKTR